MRLLAPFPVWVFLAGFVCKPGARSEESSPPFIARLPTGVEFHSKDDGLQRLYGAATKRLQENIVSFTPSMKILVEGGGYPNAWIETQPMGGEMYAKRDPQVALNNQLVFLLAQRGDGRLPGMVVSGETVRKNGWDKAPPEGYVWMPELDLAADFEMFQGFCFPEPAWRMYHWMGRDKAYLGKLRDTLKAYDDYLWRVRDSNGDGLLETWCVWDTGEDHCNRLTKRWAPDCWPFEKPPGAEGLPDPRNPKDYGKYWSRPLTDGQSPPTPEEVLVPFASMDVMAYSYSARATLAAISAELGDGEEEPWRHRAGEVRARLVEKLWVPDRHACFDLDRKGRRLPELVHNNLRCMWYGIFTQKMADAFIKHHLLNPREFWTPMPLVSIAANESLYENAKGNNWSGQPQGLTYQRAIGALERYGHFAEVTLIGEKLLPALIRNGCRFSQQLDPVTGSPSGPKPDGYGPMILSALEYLSRMHGIQLDVEHGRVWWSAVDAGGKDFTYSQRWGGHSFRIEFRDGRLRGYVGDRLAFTSSGGVRIVTDLGGKVREIVGVSPVEQNLALEVEGKVIRLRVSPNEIHEIRAGKPELKQAVAFDFPS